MPSLRLGSIAPDFEAQTTTGPIKFHEWLGNSWAILFSHPADFTPVCTTELGEVARRQKDFEARGVKVIGLSANGLESHTEWIKDINAVGNKIGPTDVQFPIIADADRKVATLYDMLDAVDPTNVDAKGIPFTIRTVFVIDPKKVIRLTISYPAQTGRSFDEILRVIDSLQLGDKHRITTPVNWKKGDDVIIHPGVSDAEAQKLFPNYVTHTIISLKIHAARDEGVRDEVRGEVRGGNRVGEVRERGHGEGHEGRVEGAHGGDRGEDPDEGGRGGACDGAHDEGRGEGRGGGHDDGESRDGVVRRTWLLPYLLVVGGGGDDA
ncbi:hypothetical protein CTheo_2711 [Ceratobasidium theobromae]|uniref:Thioredoxin domain-containing protein n=1 Tax=Ceratobasidium theobromae TaxID=1582974 RepID=A0A5N5QQD6_9AGAM|nr:hypothetical protein CTheo_2711 [Ceratobasidium theobromae]